MRVLLVTSWGNRCGIAEHSGLLKEAVEAADSSIEVIPSAAALDPSWVFSDRFSREGWDLIHLNHHDALHNRWTSHMVGELTARGIPVLITYHDTRASIEDCPKLQALSLVASSVVVHEPVEGLKAIYWRQGVPAGAVGPYQFGQARFNDDRTAAGVSFKAFGQQPVLGSIGFNFPWKNFDRLAEETGRAGWALLLIAHDATAEHEAYWRSLNPYSWIIREFRSQPDVMSLLSACDATAFMYECANTGTSAAIRQGIAARKPVIAFASCRQFRDLLDIDYNSEPEAGLIRSGVRWCANWDEFRYALRTVAPAPWDPDISALAHLDSWQKQGQRYAELYRMLVKKPLDATVEGSVM